MNIIHEENDVIGPEKLARVKTQLKWENILASLSGWNTQQLI